jgi:hypothetical protein
MIHEGDASVIIFFMNVTSNAIGTIGVMAGKELFPKARVGKH